MTAPSSHPPAQPDPAKALTSLLKRLADELGEPEAAEAPPTNGIDAGEPVLAEFVWSFLLWESTTSRAAAATKRLAAAVVDFNELRVCLPDEMCGILGERYPRALERSQRLRAALGGVYVREHAVTLEPLASLGKREAKEYLDSLEGVPPFVAARVLVFALGGHAVPVDSRLLHRLVQAGIVPEETDAEGAAGSVERRIRAAEILGACRLFQAWSDAEGAEPGDGLSPKRAGRAGAGKPGKAGSRK